MSIGIWQTVLVLLIALTLVGTWRGVRRAGYSGAWSLFLLIPLVNIIMIWVFAFATWPVEEKGRPGP